MSCRQTVTESETASISSDRVGFDTFVHFFREAYNENGEVSTEMTLLKVF
jgi:hypothetical protein